MQRNVQGWSSRLHLRLDGHFSYKLSYPRLCCCPASLLCPLRGLTRRSEVSLRGSGGFGGWGPRASPGPCPRQPGTADQTRRPRGLLLGRGGAVNHCTHSVHWETWSPMEQSRALMGTCQLFLTFGARVRGQASFLQHQPGSLCACR